MIARVATTIVTGVGVDVGAGAGVGAELVAGVGVGLGVGVATRVLTAMEVVSHSEQSQVMMNHHARCLLPLAPE